MKQEKLNRRKFVEKLGFLAGSTVLAGTMPWIDLLKLEQPTSVAPSDKVRIGVIGVGGRGRALLLHLKTLPTVDVAAVCDDYEPNYQRALKLTDYKAKGFYNYKRMLEMKDLDAVVIATPLYWHARMTIDAFSAGKHVFCEKSMAKNMEDCYNMVKAQEKAGKVLLIGHQRLFNPIYIEAMEQIKSGKLGKVTQIRAYWHRNNDWRRPVPHPTLERKINWRLYWDYSLGLITELGSHHFQVANWVQNQYPVEAMGSGSVNYWHDGREVYDNINLVYRYPNGNHLVYDSMISNKKYGLQIQVLGDEGTLELETNKYYSENPPEPLAIKRLVNDVENDIFNAIPIGGASWIPETAQDYDGKLILNKRSSEIPNDTNMIMEAFAEMVKENRVIPELIREGYYASMNAMMGDVAMRENKIVTFPEKYKIPYTYS